MWTRGLAVYCWLLLAIAPRAAQAATPYAKEYRSGGVFKGNTLIDLEGSTTLDMGAEKPTSSSGQSAGFKSESSVILPGMQLNTGTCRIISSLWLIRILKCISSDPRQIPVSN